jgi:hypothetical protein
MEIAEAFTEEALAAADANVGGEEEDEVRRVIQEIYKANEMVSDRDMENVAVLCFVAGRAYQEDLNKIPVYMSRQMAGEFMEYLVQRGAS